MEQEGVDEFNHFQGLVNTIQHSVRRKFTRAGTPAAIAWLIVDNSSTHAGWEGVEPRVWTVDGLSRRGFYLSHTNVVHFPSNTTSKVNRLDAGIIATFKAFHRELVRWTLNQLETPALRTRTSRCPHSYCMGSWCMVKYDEHNNTQFSG